MRRAIIHIAIIAIELAGKLQCTQKKPTYSVNILFYL